MVELTRVFMYEFYQKMNKRKCFVFNTGQTLRLLGLF